MDVLIHYEGKQVRFNDVSSTDYIGRILLSGEWYEKSNLEFIRSLGAVGNYVDVGSYIGTHAIYFSMFCGAKHVYAFEPHAENYNHLQHNLSINEVHNCSPFQCALMEENTEGSMAEDKLNMGHTILQPGTGTVVRTLDSFSFEDVKVLKIDVEGLEYRTLKGGQQTLKQVEHLFVEVWDEGQCRSYQCPYMFPQICQYLGQLGFQYRTTLTDSLRYFERS